MVPMVLLSVAFVPLVFAADSSNQDNNKVDNNDSTPETDSNSDPNAQLASSLNNDREGDTTILPAESTTTPLHNVTVRLPQNILDEIEDSFFDALSRDPSCDDDGDCWSPPQSTVETDEHESSEDGSNGGDTCVSDYLETAAEESLSGAKSSADKACLSASVDKHWGSDPTILRMRDKLREAGSVASSNPQQQTDGDDSNQKKKTTTSLKNKRPPVFLLPGLASTRLISWKFKGCPQHPLLSDIKVLDIAWLNINLIFQMGTFESSCLKDCLTLGLNQTDTDDLDTGCKLRPDEGLDAISSLSPGGIGSDLLVGGTNTVYAWLIQWLADNLGYDVTNIIGLPYDWRLSPQRMENRDGFLTLTRRRIEAAVKSNGEPGIMVAHSMGNVIFRYFLEWLRQEMREESYQQYLKRAERRAKKINLQHQAKQADGDVNVAQPSGWMSGVLSGFDEWWSAYFSAQEEGDSSGDSDGPENEHGKHPQLWDLAKIEGDENWIEWLEKHIWTDRKSVV